MAELHKMVVTDPNTKNLTREQKEAYIAALEEHHKRKVVGVQAYNLAAARDVVAMMDRIIKETGVYGTLFVVHGHINDTIQSAMHGMDNSEDLWEDEYKHPMADFLRQYEQWACTQNQNLNEHDSLGAVKKASMQDDPPGPSNYKTSIIKTYRVRLVGWPHGVKFINPSNIGTVKTRMSKLDTHHSAGEAIRKPRKKHSDAGVPWKRKGGPSTGRANKENHRPSKRGKKNPAQLQECPKSAEFVESSDEEGEADEE
ncbi:hypothetical protein BDR07DRAFT_1375315 [Suillus spraguei]|nr:hypothetical protein BDR07DRAFT_1375315 [Suillus spraguei]